MRVMNHAPSDRVSASETVLPLWETGPEEDAFFHAGGRIDALSIVDASELDRRSDPTVQIRRYETRRSWLVTGLVALMAPLLLLAVVIGIGQAATRATTRETAARVRTVDDARTALSLTTVTRAPIAMQQASDLPAPRGRGPRSHRSGR